MERPLVTSPLIRILLSMESGEEVTDEPSNGEVKDHLPLVFHLICLITVPNEIV